ncbi:hypothetical protein AB3S75_025550 [Citrus x aurantiifolia]
MLKILIHSRLLNDGHSSIREYVYSLPDRASAKGTAAMRLVNSNECSARRYTQPTKVRLNSRMGFAEQMVLESSCN